MNKRMLLPSALFLGALSLQAQTEWTPEQLEAEEKGIQLTDGVFREYRLAVLLTKEELYSEKSGGDRDKVKAYLKTLESYLDSIYVRDLGLKFNMVYDDRLIDENLSSKHAYMENSTDNIDARIGTEAYDAGVTMNYKGYEGSARGGLAYVGGIAQECWKGCVMSSQQDDHTVAHELGHHFGARHTFETGSEPGSGQSVVGYGFNGKTLFLSLASLQQIFPYITGRADQRLTDSQKHKAENTPPLIDRTRMKREYTVLKNTFFTLPVYASDAEQSELYYCMNQWDYAAYAPARFPTIAPSRSNVLSFGRRYSGGTVVPGSDELPVGKYKLLISVSDALPLDEAIARKQGPLYDKFLTVINVTDGTPFKITSGFYTSLYDDTWFGVKRKACKTGEKLKLTWDVDKSFFGPNSKVRILLSDDAGETYKYVLNPCTANDGECEIVLPQAPIELKTTNYIVTWDGKQQPIEKVGQAQIRIETLDGRFFDITENCPSIVQGTDEPQKAGTHVDQNDIRFSGMPEDNCTRIKADEDQLALPAITAAKDGTPLEVTFTQSREGNVTRRLWTATDGTAEAAYVQFVEREAAPLDVTLYDTHGQTEGISYIAAFSAPFATVLPEGVEAWYVSSADGRAELKPVDGRILPSHQGVVLTSSTQQTVRMVPAEDDAGRENPLEGVNLLANSAESSRVINADDHAYMLAQGPDGWAFYPAAAGDTLSIDKAFLTHQAAVPSISLHFEGSATGIGQTAVAGKEATVTHDLSGRKSQGKDKGVYIRQGRKILVK